MMLDIDFKYRANLYNDYLLENVMPFWMNNSIDKEFGGYFTSLNQDGEVYDTDKFVWLQCRQVWTLAMLYNTVEQKKEWLEAAIDGADFLLKNGRDEQGNWYFSLTREGKPLTHPYSIFSDCFAAMAYAQLYKATDKEKYAQVAKQTFEIIINKKDNPKAGYQKQFSGTRDLKGFSLPMILCNLVLEIEHLLEPHVVEETLRYGVNEVMNVFYKEEHGLILENVDLNGNFNDSFEGRLINPGHGLEAMWFVLDIATKWNDEALKEKCTKIILSILEFGWDKEYGGIFYFKDIKGYPTKELEWDQKLWWVHLESAIAALKAYQLTGNKDCLSWYEKLHDYIWEHFVDQDRGEMFGYLNRQGDVLLPLKGGKWKGCFHVPRALYQLGKLSQEIHQKELQSTSN